MSTTPGSFIWYELMTTDADAAARFYGSVVGWKIGSRPAAATAGMRDYRAIARDDGGHAGGVLQLTDAMREGGARPAWVGYLHVKSVDEAIIAIERDGGNVLMGKLSLPVGDIAMVTDPMGAPFYVMNPIPPAGKPDATSDVFATETPQRVNWNELTTPDLARAKAFYATHFHFDYPDALLMGAFGEYRFIDHGSLRIGGMMKQPAHAAGAGWQFYFGVESVLAAHRAIVAGGGRVLREPHQVPGGAWITAAADPQGAVFGITGPKGD